MQNQNTVYCKFQGRFTLHVSRRDYKYVYSYPVEICFYKTGLNEKGKNKKGNVKTWTKYSMIYS